MRISPAAAINDPHLLGVGFQGPSWNRWRAVLKAAYGERLNHRERALFRQVAERNPPTKQVRELWCAIGRRAGKDSIASAIATIGDYSRFLRPGERASVLCLACDRQQARIVMGYIKANFNTNVLLAPMIERETDYSIELNNGVEIIVATGSFRAVRGRTILCAVFDEVAYWRDDASANPDFEIYNAIIPGLATLPTAMLIGISTVYRRSGLLFDRYRRFYGQDDDDVLVIKAPSRDFNPTLPQHIIDQALERDPEAAAAEWLSEWRSDLADFVERAVVEAAVAPGIAELPYMDRYDYTAFTDPSGGSSDAFTLAIAHTENERGVLVASVIDSVRVF